MVYRYRCYCVYTGKINTFEFQYFQNVRIRLTRILTFSFIKISNNPRTNQHHQQEKEERKELGKHIVKKKRTAFIYIPN